MATPGLHLHDTEFYLTTVRQKMWLEVGAAANAFLGNPADIAQSTMAGLLVVILMRAFPLPCASPPLHFFKERGNILC